MLSFRDKSNANYVEPLLKSRYGGLSGLNIVEVNHQPTVTQSLEGSGNRSVALKADDLRRCRGTAHLIVTGGSRQELVKGSAQEKQQALDTAWKALSPRGELVLSPCKWKDQDSTVKAAILKRFEYVTQHEFETPDQSVVILRKR